MHSAKDYIIRPAVVGDSKALVDLCEAHAIYERACYDRTEKKEGIELIIKSATSPLVFWVVENSDEEVVGYMSYTQEFSTWNLRYYFHMDCLYLIEDYRGKGIGRELVSTLKEEAKKEDITEIQWQTPIDNYDAIEFYKRIGAHSKEKSRFFLAP